MKNTLPGSFEERHTMVKVIKNKEEYQIALAEISTLIDRDPDPGTVEADRLELLTLLVETYESQAFPKRLISSRLWARQENSQPSSRLLKAHARLAQ